VTEASEDTAHHARGEKRTLVVATDEADRSGFCGVNRRVHRSASGATPASDSVIARSIGCSFLTCGIAEVGQTYLWPWTLGVERHGRKAV